MSSIDILAYMRNNRKEVFTLSELADALKMDKCALAVALNRLVKKGLVDKGFKGQYLNPFTSYSYLQLALDYKKPAYVSMEYALSGDIYKQNIYIYTIVTTRKVTTSKIAKELGFSASGVMKLGKALVEYHQISPRLFFGYKVGRYCFGCDSEIAFAEPEKAVLDMIYFRYFKGSYSLNSLLSDLDDMFLEDLDKDKLFNYAERFGPQMLGFVKKLDKDGWWEHSPER